MFKSHDGRPLTNRASARRVRIVAALARSREAPAGLRLNALENEARMRRRLGTEKRAAVRAKRRGLPESPTRFGRALRSVYLDCQAIVSSAAQRVFAYEALVRTREPGLESPGAMLAAASRLGAMHELGRRIRCTATGVLRRLPDGVFLFLNVHPDDLYDDDLFADDAPLSAFAHRVVLEITERQSLERMTDVRMRADRLRGIGYRIAVDDLGAGYSGLATLALLEPEVAKIDMSLVRNIHREPTKEILVRMLVSMCAALDVTVTAEGIENEEERAVVAAAGCDLMQGFLFAKPGRTALPPRRRDRSITASRSRPERREPPPVRRSQ